MGDKLLRRPLDNDFWVYDGVASPDKNWSGFGYRVQTGYGGYIGIIRPYVVSRTSDKIHWAAYARRTQKWYYGYPGCMKFRNPYMAAGWLLLGEYL